MKKIIALLLVLCMAASVCACGTNSKPNSVDEVQTGNESVQETPAVEIDDGNETPSGESENTQPEQTIEFPTATSDDAELYVRKETNGHVYLVNKFSEVAEGYKLDENGNIVDQNGKYVVMSENALRFIDVDAISFSRNRYEMTLDAREEFVDGNKDIVRITQYPVTLGVDINVLPLNATNRYLYLSSADTSIVAFEAKPNEKIIPNGEFPITKDQLVAEINENGAVKVIVTAKKAGEVKIFAKTAAGTVVGECTIVVKDGYVEHPIPTDPPTEQVNASGDITRHTHKYTEIIVKPTTTSKGYTLYVCEECGHSYKDNFVSKLPPEQASNENHVHSYKAVVVKPTKEAQGYTLHVCEICGDEYRDSFVPRLN